MKNIKKWLVLSISALSFAFVGVLPAAHGEETTGEKVQNSADETWKDTKKQGRKAKKKTRDAMGRSSRTEDMKDNAKTLEDEVDVKTKKMERKVD